MRQMRRILAVTAIVLGPVGGIPGAAWGQASTTGSSVSSLAPGDFVRITVWRKPELSGEFRILADGVIGHPLYQVINVNGMALSALTDRLRSFLTTYEQNPQVIVEPLLRVAVGGDVRAPGLYTVPAGTTIGQAIAQAGGASERGNLRKVRFNRAGRQQAVDLTDARAANAAIPVQSGDEILIGRSGNFFRDVIGPFASILGAGAAIMAATR